MRPSSAGGKTSSSAGRNLGGERLGIGPDGAGGGAHDDLGPDVGGEQDQRVLEVDAPARAVLHHPLVEHLEEDLVHVGVGLLDLVEQHDAIGPPAHRLGQTPALAVADIAGRRALEGRDGVRLLELRHVDRDDVLLAAVERFGERERRLGLADAGRPAQHEDADRLVGIVESGAVGLDASWRSSRGRGSARRCAGSGSRRGGEPSRSRRRPSCRPGCPSSPTRRRRPPARRHGRRSSAFPDRSCRARRPWRAKSRRRPRPVRIGFRASAARARPESPPQSVDAACGCTACLAILSRSARISSTSARSFVQSASSAARRSRRSAILPSISAMRSSFAAPRSRSRASDCFSLSSEAIATSASSTAAGFAFWLIATRAQAVSRRLTALSGNCRAGM